MSENEEQPGATDSRTSTVYLLAGFALSWFPLPISGLAIIPLILSFWYSVRHLRALKAAGASSPLRRAASVGLLLTTLLVGFVLAPVLQYATTMNYQRCLWGANTQQAVHACEQANHHTSNSVAKFFLD